MQIIRPVSNAISAVLILVSSLLLTIDIFILYYVLSGKISPDLPIYIDVNPPTVSFLISSIFVCCGVIAAGYFLRAKVGQKQDFKILYSGMQLARNLTSLLCTVIIAIALMWILLLSVIIFDGIRGTFGSDKSFIPTALLLEVICIAIIFVCFVVRLKFGQKNDFRFLKRKMTPS